MNLGDIYSVRLITRFSPVVGNPANSINVLYYRVAAQVGINFSDKVLADKHSNSFNNAYKNVIPTNAVYQGLIIQKVHPVPTGMATGSTVGAGAGTTVGEALPMQTCGIITKRTTGVGRKKRGRAYIPWPTEDFNTSGGVPTAAYDLLLIALASVIRATEVVVNGPDQITVIPVIAHKPKPPAVIWTSDDIASTVTRPYWGVQRRHGNAFRTDDVIIIPP